MLPFLNKDQSLFPQSVPFLAVSGVLVRKDVFVKANTNNTHTYQIMITLSWMNVNMWSGLYIRIFNRDGASSLGRHVRGIRNILVMIKAHFKILSTDCVDTIYIFFFSDFPYSYKRCCREPSSFSELVRCMGSFLHFQLYDELEFNWWVWSTTINSNIVLHQAAANSSRSNFFFLEKFQAHFLSMLHFAWWQ